MINNNIFFFILQDNIFNVDTKNAGYGGLSLSIEGPSKAKMNCRDNEDGTLDVMYNPTEPGIYLINLKYADEFIPGLITITMLWINSGLFLIQMGDQVGVRIQ